MKPQEQKAFFYVEATKDRVPNGCRQKAGLLVMGKKQNGKSQLTTN